MRAVVLGSAAGGGFPQWNSGGEGCRRARAGDPLAKSRTQASIAVSGDHKSWYLINASPDIRHQIEQTPVLHPRGSGRSSPIKGIILTGGEVDTIAGLLSLRERQAFYVFATQPVHDILNANSIFGVLSSEVVSRPIVFLDRRFPLSSPDTAVPELWCTLFAVPGKVPLYMESSGLGDEAAPETISDGSTVGACLSDGSRSLFFVPGCAAMTPSLAARVHGADCVMFDGTLWRDDEMMVAGVGGKTGQRMGHMSVSGPAGVLAAFATLDVKRKILIHLNNTNPVLLEDSAEHAAVREAGWEVAWDGMEIVL